MKKEHSGISGVAIAQRRRFRAHERSLIPVKQNLVSRNLVFQEATLWLRFENPIPGSSSS
jgi:hypothetical protein